MPITSLTWTSRQARTHRPHWMQASRLTRIAGWLGSPCQRSAAGKRLSVTSTFSAQCQNFESGSCEVSRALDLDHAGPAIAVGPVIGRRRIAQMRDFVTLALCHLPDRFTRLGLD